MIPGMLWGGEPGGKWNCCNAKWVRGVLGSTSAKGGSVRALITSDGRRGQDKAFCLDLNDTRSEWLRNVTKDLATYR
jgi:hypothetical protein